MAEKEVGYVELEWRCPSCGNRNPGSAKTCKQCGAALSDKVQFEQAPQEQIITDKDRIAAAAAGADVQCAYCGATNPATAKNCRQCGADLTGEKARAAGQVLGAFRDQPAAPLKCPSCGVDNPATALKCAKCGAPLMQPKPEAIQPAAKSPFSMAIVLAIIAGVCLFGAALIFLSTRTTDTIGEVRSLSWRRVIAIEALGPVTREAWRDEVPAGSRIGQCSKRVHHTQPNPEPGAREVCGTPYTVDQGSGYGKVVKQCVYEVSADWCQYEATDWRVVNTLVAEGADLNPIWPALTLANNQRAGGQQQEYHVSFMANDKNYGYSPATGEEFVRYSSGSKWRLKINTFGTVTAVEPVGGQ